MSLPDTVSATGLSAGLNAAVAALVLTNLAQAVDAEGDITIFVPQNQAFRAIGSALIAASPEQLAEVLQYHVVNGTVLFSTQASNMTVPSMQGNNITINVANETVFVNNAKVVLPNVIVANGVVHVIDGYAYNPRSSYAEAS